MRRAINNSTHWFFSGARAPRDIVAIFLHFFRVHHPLENDDQFLFSMVKTCKNYHSFCGNKISFTIMRGLWLQAVHELMCMQALSHRSMGTCKFIGVILGDLEMNGSWMGAIDVDDLIER